MKTYAIYGTNDRKKFIEKYWHPGAIRDFFSPEPAAGQ